MCKLCSPDPVERSQELAHLEYIQTELRKMSIFIQELQYGYIKPHEDENEWRLASIHAKNLIRELVEYL